MVDLLCKVYRTIKYIKECTKILFIPINHCLCKKSISFLFPFFLALSSSEFLWYLKKQYFECREFAIFGVKIKRSFVYLHIMVKLARKIYIFRYFPIQEISKDLIAIELDDSIDQPFWKREFKSLNNKKIRTKNMELMALN